MVPNRREPSSPLPAWQCQDPTRPRTSSPPQAARCAKPTPAEKSVQLSHLASDSTVSASEKPSRMPRSSGHRRAWSRPLPKRRYIIMIQLEEKREQALQTLPKSPESRDKLMFPNRPDRLRRLLADPFPKFQLQNPEPSPNLTAFKSIPKAVIMSFIPANLQRIHHGQSSKHERDKKRRRKESQVHATRIGIEIDMENVIAAPDRSFLGVGGINQCGK